MKKQAARVGFYASLLAFIAAAGYGVVQILRITGILIDPLDNILIYSFLLAIALPFLMSMLALHYFSPEEDRLWSHAALLFALMYAVYVILMYAVQLTSVIHLSIHNSIDTILTVKPQSFIWTIDALGYICMGLSTLCAALIFKQYPLQRLIRLFMTANGVIVPIVSLVYFYPRFSFVLLFLACLWMITLPASMLLLAVFFKKALKTMD